ncbi:MAG TPA: UPF0182 family protein, partial [Chloroflexota bacterium]|nr:UPF0182 family protein [Chloroflexota bacterium]
MIQPATGWQEGEGDGEERALGVPRWFVTLVLAGTVSIVLLVTAFVAKGLYVDWLWFESLGLGSVFLTITWTGLWLFLLVAGTTATLLLGNLFLARALARRRWRAILRGLPSVEDENEDDRRPPRDPTAVLATLSVILALLLGWWASAQWATVLRLPHGSPFGQSDPLFGLDVAHYVFTLPLLQAGRTWALWGAILALVGAAVLYFALLVLPQTAMATPRLRPVGQAGAPADDDEDEGRPRLNLALGGAIRAHLSILGAILCLVLAGHYALRRQGLVFSERGAT